MKCPDCGQKTLPVEETAWQPRGWYRVTHRWCGCGWRGEWTYTLLPPPETEDDRRMKKWRAANGLPEEP